VAAERFESIHAPVGLDIGAVVPEEIAVAIVAEMIHERRRGRPHADSKKIDLKRSSAQPADPA
jgi:xanthine dehydrogenase accessory factor